MKAIVHIGTEKTGTTSIQEFLYLNRRKLRSAGFYFIQSAGKKNNRAIPAYCIGEDKFDDFYRLEGIKTPEEKQAFKRRFLKDFENEIHSIPKNIHTVIMSSEHFHSRVRSEEEADNVYKLLSAYFDEFKIICYVREQVTTCTSYYSTHLKSAGTESFSAFLQRCKPGNNYFNYFEMLANWERCFGLDSLDIAIFSQDRFLNGDLLDDFTAKLDTSLVGALNKSIQAENESLKPFGQALARAVNTVFPIKSERAEVGELRSICNKIISPALRGKGQQPALEARKSIYDSFVESNEKLRMKFFPDVGTLFPPPVETALPENVVDEKEFEILADLFNAISKHGKGIISPEEYTHVCTAILTCIHDVTKVITDKSETGTEVILNQSDGELLRRAGRRFEGRENESALRLMTLASKVCPNRASIRSKLEEYHLRAGQPPRSQFIINYHCGDSTLELDAKDVSLRFKDWLASLSDSAENDLVGLNNTRTVNAGGTVLDDTSAIRGYSVIEADSMDALLAIVKGCPFLELGGRIEVSELAFLWDHNT